MLTLQFNNFIVSMMKYDAGNSKQRYIKIRKFCRITTWWKWSRRGHSRPAKRRGDGIIRVPKNSHASKCLLSRQTEVAARLRPPSQPIAGQLQYCN
jgi:hypothetical protein